MRAGQRLTENECGQLSDRGAAPAEGCRLMTLCCLPWKADLTARGPRVTTHVGVQIVTRTQTDVVSGGLGGSGVLIKTLLSIN